MNGLRTYNSASSIINTATTSEYWTCKKNLPILRGFPEEVQINPPPPPFVPEAKIRPNPTSGLIQLFYVAVMLGILQEKRLATFHCI